MTNRAIIHLPDEQKECEKIYKEIANCRFRNLKTYIADLNLTSNQADELKEYIKTVSNSKETEKAIMKKAVGV